MIFPAPRQGREPAYPENLVRTRDATFLYFQGAKVVAYFHGNGEDLADSVPMVSLLRSLGMGVLAVEYPGYGVAGGRPSEQGAYAAAESALSWLRSEGGIGADRVVLLGQSLGSGVACEMAKRGFGARVVLISPFTSIASIAERGTAMTPEEFRRRGHQIVDWIADYRTRVGQLPVMSRAQPGEVARRLPSSPPQQAESFDGVLRDLEEILLPGLSHWQHPRFFGYFPSNGELSSVLGDYLSTGLGVLGLSWQSSPALSELEEVVTDWLRQMVGLSGAWKGVIQDTASTSTLVALICARERATRYSLAGKGLQDEERPLVVYASAQAHSSVDKAALLGGFGRDNVRHIATDAASAMRADALAAAVREDLASGLRPCAVVATTGTTTSTALDPV